MNRFPRLTLGGLLALWLGGMAGCASPNNTAPRAHSESRPSAAEIFQGTVSVDSPEGQALMSADDPATGPSENGSGVATIEPAAYRAPAKRRDRGPGKQRDGETEGRRDRGTGVPRLPPSPRPSVDPRPERPRASQAHGARPVGLAQEARPDPPLGHPDASHPDESAQGRADNAEPSRNSETVRNRTGVADASRPAPSPRSGSKTSNEGSGDERSTAVTFMGLIRGSAGQELALIELGDRGTRVVKVGDRVFIPRPGGAVSAEVEVITPGGVQLRTADDETLVAQ